jgi:hypothetical protein
LYTTREQAVRAAEELAAGGRVVVHEPPPSRPTDEVLASLADTGDLGGGSRTTLRVPAVLERELRSLSEEIGVTKNEALVRLALAGSQLVDRARKVAATRELRRMAVLRARTPRAGELPDLDEMSEAVRAFRERDD